jgi:hypothetical protein
MGRIGTALQFLPAVLALLAIALSVSAPDVPGGVESRVIVILLVIQALVLAVPYVARLIGRKIGGARGEAED